MTTLKIHSTYENQLTSLNVLSEAKDLTELEITGDFIKNNLPFSKLTQLNKLEKLVLEPDLGGHTTFVNQQRQLRYLHLKKLDAALLQSNTAVEYLRIDTVLKNEELLHDKFSNLKTLHLHGCKGLSNFGFLASFYHLEDIYIGYNAHIQSFPVMKSAAKIRSIKLPNAYKFSDGKSLLQFSKLETLWITSHDKPLSISLADFEALRQLPKLKNVYTVWGRKNIPEVVRVYREAGWINSGLG